MWFHSKNLSKILLILIILLGFGLRFINLGVNPPGLTWDEAALGYNAYSILKTGKDEYGDTLPVILKSFGDYKPALYAYLTVPFIAVLGLNEVSVRLPSVVFGVGSIVLVYLVMQELFKKKGFEFNYLINDGYLSIGYSVFKTGF